MMFTSDVTSAIEMLLSPFTSPCNNTLTVSGVLVTPFDVHEIVAVPGAIAVTTPELDTWATAVLLLVQETDVEFGEATRVCDVPLNMLMAFVEITNP